MQPQSCRLVIQSRHSHHHIMWTKHEQIRACSLFIQSSRQNIDLSHPTFGFFDVANIDTLSAHATVHSYHACHHKRLHPTTCQNTSVGPGTIRYNDVACFCSVDNCSAWKIISHHGVFSTQYCIKYDASLTGLGVGIYNLSTSEIITCTAMSLPFEVTNESKRQNTMEFIAVILGLLLAWRASLHHFTYNLHGDSISSYTRNT